MRSSLMLTALCAATALAADVQKRSYKTEVVVVTVTRTVYPGQEPTALPSDDPVNKHNPPQNNPPPPAEADPTQDMPIIGDNPAPTKDPKPEPQKPKPQPQEPKPEPQKPKPQPQEPEPQTTQYQPEPQPTETEPEPTTAPAPAPQPPASGYKGQVLEHHNMHRSNHSANAIQWSEDLVSSARQLAQSCVYGHNT